jgi:hypothetical protein
VPSPRRPVAAAEGPRAVPSLRVPSAPAFPAAPATLVVPRIAATDEMFGSNDRHRRDSTDMSSSDKTFVFRQIIEYPAMSDAAVAALDRAVHAEADASLEHARVAPESYLLRDVRSDAFLVAEQNLADRVVAARRSKEAAYAARRAEELAAEAEEARRLAEEALDSGIYALAREAKVAPRGPPAPPRGPKPAFPPVSFFDVEEGREALRAMETRETDFTREDTFATRAYAKNETFRTRRNPALLGPADVTAATRRRFASAVGAFGRSGTAAAARVFVGRRSGRGIIVVRKGRKVVRKGRRPSRERSARV